MKEEVFYFVSNEVERKKLRILARAQVKRNMKFLLYTAFFLMLGMAFLAYAGYGVWLFFQEFGGIPLQAWIYIIVPIVGAGLSVGFIVQKYRRMTVDLCEAENVTLTFLPNRISVRGLNTSKADTYELEIAAIRYYAYDEEQGKFRWILGKTDYPDLIVPRGESLERIFAKLDALGISKTAYIR